MLAILGLVALAVWFTPPLIALTPLRDTLLNLALPGGESIHSGSASFGWLSPIEIADVRLYDRQGELLAAAPSIRLERRLIDLAIDPRRVGVVRLEQPEVHVALRAGGSNWEDFLAPWLMPGDEPAQPVAVAVEVRDGRAVVVDTVAGRTWKATSVRVDLLMSDDKAATMKLAAHASLATGEASADQQQPGKLEVRIDTRPAATDNLAQNGSGRLTLQTDALPLAAGESLLARFVPGAVLSGNLTSNMTLTWADAADQMRVSVAGRATVEDLSLAAEALGDDRLTLARLEIAPAALAWQNDRLTIERLSVACDLGRLSVGGAVGTEQLSAERVMEALGAVVREDYKIDAEVDLARLAAMLPGVLRVREETTITAGKLQISLESVAGPEGHVWQGSLATDRLAATSRGRPLVWDRPVHVAWTARDAAEGFKVDELVCRSDFLQLQASGTLDAMTAAANYDLSRLADHLDQLIDLVGWRFGGQGTANLVFHREPGGAFRVDTSLTVDRFQLTHPERPPWTEERVSLKASAAGTLEGTTVRDLESASAQVLAGGDRLSARLVRGVSIGDGQKNWPIEITWEGRLARWTPRLAPWVALDNWDLDGQGRLTAVADLAGDAVDIRQAKLTVEQFQVHTASLAIDDPHVELEGRARWDQSAGRLDIAGAKLTSTALALQIDEAAWQAGDGTAPKISGTLGFEAVLDRLYRWTVDARRPPPWWPAGRVTGRARLAHLGGKTEAHLELTGRDAQLYEHVPAATGGSPYRLIWREPELSLAADASYDRATDSLQIDRSQLRSGTVDVSVAGTIGALATEQRLDLAGTIDYDLEKITPLVRPYLGPGVQLVGRDTATWNIHGPLAAARVGMAESATGWSRRLAGRAGFAWQRADIYGLPLGPGRLDATLGDGVLRTAPLDLAVLEGRLTVAPIVQIDPGPMELMLPAGPLVEKARITPEVADTMLKYVAPVLADATRTEGRFSIRLEGVRVPLADPARARLAGRLAIEQVRVTPGPLAKEFIRIGQQIEALLKRRSPVAAGLRSERELLTIDNQDVAFQMVDGRVYHRSLEMTVGRNVRVRTSGWIGVDETLAILAEVPIQDEWIRHEPLLEGLRNQTLRIPIGGTFSRPQVDGRAMARLSKQLLGGAVRGAITNELNKQLDKLLRGH